MADNKFVLDFIAKVTPDKNSIYSLKNDIKKATGLMDNYNNTVEMKEKSASARRHNVARNQSKQLAENIINDWKSKNIDITSLMGLSPQELDKSFDKVHKTFNKNAKKMQTDLSKSEKKQTEIVEKEEKKRANIKAKAYKSGTYTSNSKYGIPVGMEGHTSPEFDSKYGKVTSISSEFSAKNGLKYRNVVREITDEYNNLVKTTLRYRVAEDQNYYVGKKVLIDKKAKLKLEKDSVEALKKQENLEKLMANLSAKHSMSGKYDTSYAGTGKVTGQGVLSTKGLPEGTQRFFQDIDDGKGKIERWERIVDKSGKTLNTFRTSMKEANRDHKTFSDQIKIATSRIFQWAVATNLVYGSLNQLRQGIGFVIELDNKMNEVRMVTGATADEAKRLSQEYNNLASQMGVTTMDVANMANEFYRQGLGQEETNNRMKETIKYSKIAGMTTEETAEIITASANSYELAGDEVGKMVDQLSFLGDASAAGASEIGRGMQKVAGSAKLAGIEYEWLAAKIATISETTRESSQTIGNSLKSILVRYSAIKTKGLKSGEYNEVVKALKSVGINAVGADKQLRNFQDVIDELGGKWDSLNKKSQAYVATAIAGSYQANRFSVMMMKNGRSLELYNGALNSAGNAQKKFDISLESSGAKINNFKSSAEKMWMNFINSDALKFVIDLGTKTITLVDKVGLLNAALVTLTTVGIGKAVIGIQNLNKALLEYNALLMTSGKGTLGMGQYLLGMAKNAGLIGGILLAAGISVKYISDMKKINDEYKKAEEHLKTMNSLQRDFFVESQKNDPAISSADKYKNLLKIQKEINDTQVNNANAIIALEQKKAMWQNRLVNKNLRNQNTKEEIDAIKRIEDEINKLSNVEKQNKIVSENVHNAKMNALKDQSTSYENFTALSSELSLFEQKNLINLLKTYKSTEENKTKIKILETQKRMKAMLAELAVLESIAKEARKFGEVDAQGKIIDVVDSAYKGFTGKYGTSEASIRDAINKATKDLNSLTYGTPINPTVTDTAKKSKDQKQLNDYLKDEQKYLNDIAKAENLSKGLTDDQREERIAGIKAEKKEQQDLINYYKKILPTIKEKKLKAELEGKIIDAQGKIASLSKDILETQMKITEEAKKQREELVKKQEEALKNILDLTEKMIEQEKKDAVDALKDQIDKYDEIISQKKKIIDLTESQRDYENELVDKQKSVSDIQDDIAVLSLDSSRESIAKRLELESDLKEKQKELNEYQHDRNIELQQNALDTELDSYKKTKESEIKTLEDYLNNAGRLSADAMALINSQSDAVYQSLLKWNQQYGTSIDKDITDAWKNASAAISDYKTKLGGFDIGGALNSISNELNPSLSKNNASLLPNLGDLGKSDLWNNAAKNMTTTAQSQVSSVYNNASTIDGGLNIETLVKVEGNATTETIEKIKNAANDIVTDINNSLRLRGNGRTAGVFA